MEAAAACLRWLEWGLAAAAFLWALWSAYDIRLYAVKDYGPVIHEFDPWFNFRAAEYLAQRGWGAFFTWFDHMSWYPLGRPVATTIYPGLQLTAVAIFYVLELVGYPMSINDVCVYVPAWFGVLAAASVGLLAYECSSRSPLTAACGAMVMAVLPAGAMRGVAGLFDNECVALPVMSTTFWLWCRSLRCPESWPVAGVAGAAYGLIAATWGGYVFALNVVGVHAALLAICGACSAAHLHRAYSLFFIVGTLVATRVPVVGWAPLRSLEQLGPLGVFLALQFAAVARRSRCSDGFLLHLASLGVVAALTLGIVLLYPSGFWPLSARVRALFTEHTRTGNPLVDSVAEHQPAGPEAFWTYLDRACYVAPLGLVCILAAPGKLGRPTDAGLFLAVLSGLAYCFCLRMKRLMVLMGPPTATLAGIALGRACDEAVAPIHRTLLGASSREGSLRVLAIWNSFWGRAFRVPLAAYLVYGALPVCHNFYDACHQTVRYTLSHPQIVFKASNGGLIDDYREAYQWLRLHTPEDARVMAWWDYGYQIAGLANRTTLADGNTWSQEHIALLGLCLSSPMAEAHRIARHLADYILVWAGQGKDDVGKSSHMARIANSVFKGHCAEEDCNQFGVRRNGQPTPSMAHSLIWHLCGRAGLEGQPFEEVYRNGRVRIVRVLGVSEASRSFPTSPEGRQCDGEGSWYCPGRYSPALQELIGAKDITPGNREAEVHRREFKARQLHLEGLRPRKNGQGLPPGSYLDSCAGCSLEGGKNLHCTHCRLPGFPAEPSSLDVTMCSLKEVDNIHGTLQCHPKPNAPDVPQGAYLRSCRGCELREAGTLLFCSNCGRADGSHARSSFHTASCPSPGSFDNQDGVLTCLGLPHGPGIPRGRYSESCQGCHLMRRSESTASHAVLQCALCRAANGSQRPAGYELHRCQPPGVIDNRDGSLACVAGS